MRPTPRLSLRPVFGLFAFALSVGVAGCYEPLTDEQSATGDSGDSGGSGSSAGSDSGGNSSSDGAGETGSAGDSDSSGGEPPPTAPDGYYVLGNKIYDGNDEVHIFRGVDRPSLEWNSEGEMVSNGDIDLIASWNSNVVRIALNQGFWLEGSVVYDASYKQRVDQTIAWVEAAGMDVILDLHWTDRGDFSVVPGQQLMADENSRTFWADVAARYKDDGRVFFELYNEPHDVQWEVWLNGGITGDGFVAVGMQELYDTVRAAGADNLVIVGGLDYAYDLKGVPGHRVEGYNIVYATHPYDFATKQPASWDRDWGFLAESDPLFVTEFGSFDCDPTYSQTLIDYAEQRGLSWSAWAWYPGGCNFPALIEDWSGTPSATGQIVKTALEAN